MNTSHLPQLCTMGYSVRIMCTMGESNDERENGSWTRERKRKGDVTCRCGCCCEDRG